VNRSALVARDRDDVSASVAHIVLADAEGHNAFSLAWAEQFATAVTEAVDDSDTHVVLISSSGRNFSVGGDLRSLSAAERPAETMAGLVDAMHPALALLHCGAKPVVAAVRGACAGGALGIVLAADVVVAEPDASFVPGYPRLGLTPDCGVSAWLPRMVGLRKALSFSLSIDGWSAEQAREAGLVTEVSAAGASLKRALTWAEGMVGQGQSAGPTRQLLRQSLDGDPVGRLDVEREAIVRLAGTDRFRTALEAFGRLPG